MAAADAIGSGEVDSRVRVLRGIASPHRAAAGTPSTVRQSNLALVASEILASGGGISRAEVASRTGLTGPTVSRLVRDLISSGVVSERVAESDGSMGRPGSPLYPSDRSIVGIGLEVNVDYIAGCAVGLSGHIVEHFTVRFEEEHPQPVALLSRMKRETEAMIHALRASGSLEICGICLAIPGAVDIETGRVRYASNLGWRNVDPAEILGGLLPDSTLFSIDNDANLQAIAAASAIAEPDADLPSFLYVFSEIGIGGAILRNGALERGTHGWAGEIGHTAVDPDGAQCFCGSQGCLETYIGRRALLSASGLPPGTTTEDLVRELSSGNPKAQAAIDVAGRALGIALANAINLMDIEAVILGIGLGPLLPWLEPRILEQLDRRLLGRSGDTITLSAMPLTTFPSSIGGALKCIHERIRAANLAR